MPVDFHGHFALFGIFGQINDASFVTQLYADFRKLGSVKGERSGVEAGVAGEFLRGKNILVQHKTNLAVCVIYKRKYAGAAAFDPQNVFKVFFCGEAQTGAAKLCGKILGLEWLVTGHYQQIEIGLLTVGEEKIFCDAAAEHRFGGGKIIHASHKVRINSLIPGEKDYYENSHKLLKARRYINWQGPGMVPTIQSPAYFLW